MMNIQVRMTRAADVFNPMIEETEVVLSVAVSHDIKKAEMVLNTERVRI